MCTWHNFRNRLNWDLEISEKDIQLDDTQIHIII